jgi:alpha-glucoside transport system permease protein
LVSETQQKFVMLAYGVGAFALVVGLILLIADRAPKRGREKVQIGLFIGPALALVTIGLIIPVFRTTLLSVKDSAGDKFVGLANFQWMFTSPDARTVLVNTAIWVLLAPFVATTVGLVYSILVDGSRFEAAYKALIFLPMAISMVASSIIWKFVYDYRGGGNAQIGLLNQVLVWFGGTPQQFIQNSPWNNLFLIVILVWIQAGFAMVVLSAAIKGIPADIVEAAKLDGANPFQMFFRITLPSIRPAVLVVYITILITTLKVFDIVRTMTNGNFDTSVIANEMYNQSFRYDEDGKGAALAVVLFILVLPVVVYQVRQLRRLKLESR